jgi:nucleotide-binding universal stress UspA family protein
MIRIQNVLVATDFSQTADAALNYGREIARTFGGRLHVLHVTDSIYTPFAGESYIPVSPDLQRDVEEAARKQLEAGLDDEDRATLQTRPVVVTAVSTPAAIVEYAREHRIDLIVMGTQGRGLISQLLMGSVAERVVRTAACPVLTVHHPEHEFIRPDALVAVARA